MKFDNHKAIFLQIVDLVTSKIANNDWLPDEKIPSVRDLGAELEVNPNTVMRAYELLQQKDIIYNKRGLGFFVKPMAAENIVKSKKKQFLEVDLPVFFKTMKVLNISIDEIIDQYHKIK